QHQPLVTAEAVDPLEQFEHIEPRRAIGHLAEVHLAVAGDEVLRVHEAEVDVEGLDQLFDLGGDGRPVFFQLRGGGDEHRVAEGDVLGNIEKADLAVVNPGLHGEFPAVQVAFQQGGKFRVGDVVDILRG